MKVRIGIDVGGTFTDGVALDNETLKVIKKIKVPTTHAHEYGVSKGIIEVLSKLIEELELSPEEIVFLAHGTTQATNALLEGDVTKVGIIGTASGLEMGRTRTDSNIESVKLTKHKAIKTFHRFLENSELDNKLDEIIKELKADGAKVIVAAEPYSVDNPANELLIQKTAEKLSLPATSTHEISSLYGLKLRTRTAVINASILPKMIETSNMTEQAVLDANIDSQLMIMRCDGGVMSVEEVRSRPIMTLLSGPAAGVAGALMHEKISDGLFLEVGGTSTDISAIKNGEVMLKYAEVGGHKTYVNSLDVRTLGIAGGSMIQIEGNKIIDVGPRSAHIAGFEYESFANPKDIVNPEVKIYSGDGDSYVYIESENAKTFALTLTGAANILSDDLSGTYSSGNKTSAMKAYAALAQFTNLSVEEVARQVMDIAVEKVRVTLEGLIEEYDLDKNIIEIVGGGGGSGSIVPFTGEKMELPARLADNAEVISTIGVALAMIREVVERSVINPSDEDVLKLRKEVEEKIIRSGANPQTIDIKIEIDKTNNILRAIATGSSEFKKQELNKVLLPENEIIEIAAKTFNNKGEISKVAETDFLTVIQQVESKKKLFGLLNNKVKHQRVITKEGVIKLRLTDYDSIYANLSDIFEILELELAKRTRYTDGGEEVPYVYIGVGSRILDMSGLVSREQILSMTEVELKYADKAQSGFILFGEK